MSRKGIEYLLRPLIEGAVFTIENNYVRIASPSTIHAEARLVTILSKAKLLAMYKAILQKAKTQKVKISFAQHIRKQIHDRWEEYESCCAEAGILFAQIIEQAKVVQARGLHYGTVDDTELAELQKLCSKHSKFFYGASVISRIAEISFRLESIDHDLSASESRLDQIYL